MVYNLPGRVSYLLKRLCNLPGEGGHTSCGGYTILSKRVFNFPLEGMHHLDEDILLLEEGV